MQFSMALLDISRNVNQAPMISIGRILTWDHIVSLYQLELILKMLTVLK